MVFVTGATGLLGSQLVKYLLKKNYQVRALKRSTSDLSLLNGFEHQIEWIEGDVLNILSLEEALEGVKQVYHVAGMISFIPSERDKMLKINIEGTANVVNACLDASIDKLVHVSSVAAFGNSKENVLLDESTQWEEDDIKSPYARSKFLGEMEVWRGMAEGLKAVIANPSLIVGPGYWTGSGPAAIFNKIDEGVPVYTHGTNGYVDVRDVAEVMIQLMESNIVNQRFVVSAENLSYMNYFGLVSNALGKKKPFIPISNRAGILLSFFDKIRAGIMGGEPLITPEMIKVANKKMLFDNTAVLNALNFSFRTIEQSVNDTAQLFSESKKARVKYATFS